MRIAVVLVAFMACVGMSTGCTVGGGNMSDAELDETTLDSLAGYMTLDRINTRPYTSTVGPFPVNCFVDGDVDGYRKIHPDRAGANVTVAFGTVIVREVLDTRGQITKLTVMAKGPPGYDPRLGDWWFAVTDPRGAPLTENGIVQFGRLVACHNCHLDRTRDDFLFGVPAGI